MANVVTKGINSAIHARATSRRSRELLEIGHERVRALDEATVERDRRLAEVMSAYEARVAAIEHEAERRRSELESSAMDIDETITAKSAVALPVTSTTHVDDEHHDDDHTMTTGCPLCFSDDVQPEVELQPCGHRLCVECADRMQELELKQCPWDRREIERFRRHGCRCDDDDGSDTRTTSGTMASPTIRP